MHPPRTVLAVLAVAALCAAPARLAAQTPQRTIPVRLSEYRIDIPDVVQQGQVVLAVTNTGREAHSFQIRGHRAQQRTRLLQPGESVNLPVRLIVGDYVSYCAVKTGDQEHRKMGMEKHTRVVW